ncbi:MAG: hypothetical protein KDD43_00290 [Bdellovibrionales bacterium]|nr:hypothetical protein [Bdellovibrionales bacterium]
MTQNIEIQYGTYKIGVTSSSIREGTFRLDRSYRSFSLDVDVIVTGTSDSNFVANCQAIEDAFEKDNQQLTIKYGPAGGTQQTYCDYNPTNFTGLNIRGHANKPGSDFDTDRSRLYSVSINGELPADSSDDDFRQSANWTLAFDESRLMTLSFGGVYTAGYPSSVATKATKSYLDNVATWISSVFTDLDGIFSAFSITEADFELMPETVEALDDDHHKIRFSRTYKQVNFPNTTWSSGTPNNNSSINNAQVKFTRTYTNNHGNNQIGVIKVRVDYSCSVDRTATSYTAMKALWTDSIKGWLVSQAKDRWGGTLSAIENGSEDLDVSGNTIRANMTIMIFAGNSGILSEDVTITLQGDDGKNYVPVWDGVPYSYSVTTNGGQLTATVTSTVSRVGSIASMPGAPPAASGGGSWDRTGYTRPVGSSYVGKDPDGKGAAVLIYTTTWTVNWRWIVSAGSVSRGTVERSSGGSSGGGAPGSGGASAVTPPKKTVRFDQVGINSGAIPGYSSGGNS